MERWNAGTPKCRDIGLLKPSTGKLKLKYKIIKPEPQNEFPNGLLKPTNIPNPCSLLVYARIYAIPIARLYHW